MFYTGISSSDAGIAQSGWAGRPRITGSIPGRPRVFPLRDVRLTPWYSWGLVLLGCYAVYVGSCLPKLRDRYIPSDVPEEWSVQNAQTNSGAQPVSHSVGNRGLFHRGQWGRGFKLTTQFNLVPAIQISGEVPTLQYMFLRHAEGKILLNKTWLIYSWPWKSDGSMLYDGKHKIFNNHIVMQCATKDHVKKCTLRVPG